MQYDRGFPEEEILDALAVAGLIGNVIRTNASISGAECGCQAEIGSACSMTAAALASLYGLNIEQVEYAAEIAMEHNLGLTCDPVKGLVQIPCIERKRRRRDEGPSARQPFPASCSPPERSRLTKWWRRCTRQEKI